MREIELLRECRDLLEEVDRLISQIGSFEIDKTEFRVDEKEQLLVITINDSEGDVFTYKNAYEFLYEYILIGGDYIERFNFILQWYWKYKIYCQ